MAANALRDFDRFLEEQLPSFDESLQHFKQLLTEMTRHERERHSIMLTRLYHIILRTQLRKTKGPLYLPVQEFGEAFFDSMQIVMAGGGGDASLCDYFLKLALQFLMTNSDRELVECILSRLSGESWWVIRGSTLLMENMQFSRPHSIALLKYGYPYSFHRKYFKFSCREISLGFLQKGEYFPREISRKVRSWSQGASLRLQMTLEILVAVLIKEGDNRYREIVSVLWKTVPHPFISSTEMFGLMAPFFVEYPQKLQHLCEEYAKCNTVFEVPQVTCPRSLFHLCRVQVRKNLLDAKKLNDGTIDGLDIPLTVKSYLKLDSF